MPEAIFPLRSKSKRTTLGVAVTGTTIIGNMRALVATANLNVYPQSNLYKLVWQIPNVLLFLPSHVGRWKLSVADTRTENKWNCVETYMRWKATATFWPLWQSYFEELIMINFQWYFLIVKHVWTQNTSRGPNMKLKCAETCIPWRQSRIITMSKARLFPEQVCL